jgi:hypothetical protein
MSMLYVKKDVEGKVIAISQDPADGQQPGWGECAEDAHEVFIFSAKIVQASSGFERSDLSFVRVIEDIIDLLVDRAVIRFTDLPGPAQAKLLERKSRRDVQKLSLLDDEVL